MPPPLSRILCILMALAGWVGPAAAVAAGPAAEGPEPPVRAVREALGAFDAQVSGSLDGRPSMRPGAAASESLVSATRTLVRFALASDRIVIDVGPEAVTWCDARKDLLKQAGAGERGLLLAAYVAGEVRAQLDGGRPDPNPYAGWTRMLRLYRILQVREGVSLPEIDALLARERAGTLAAFAAGAHERSLERLRRTYGGSGEPPAEQPSLAQARP